jgi:hypothetical protein
MRDSPRSTRRTIHAALAAACTLAATLALAAPVSTEEHVGLNAEKGDPARWYVPADTPRLKYETLVKEARNALAEELKECRAFQSARADCIAQAKEQHRRDMEAARLVLANGGSRNR